MSKKHLRLAICGAFLCLLAVWLTVACVRGRQSSSSFPIPLIFTGEYSQDGGTWQPLTDTTKLNALDGDLALRGHFDMDTSGSIVHFYLDHIFLSVSVNGELVYSVEPVVEDGTRGFCANWWDGWKTDTLTSEDTVEFYLSNPHQNGNPRAYEDFLNRLYVGNSNVFQNYILHPAAFLAGAMTDHVPGALQDFLTSGQVWRTVAIIILILSLLLLGVALADTLNGALFGSRLWCMVFLSFFSGGLIWLDSRDIALAGRLLEFNTYGAQICRMLVLLGIGFCVSTLLNGRWKQIARACTAAVGVFDAILALVGIIGIATACDLTGVWSVVQAAFCLLLLAGCLLQFRGGVHKDTARIGAAVILIFAMLTELANSHFGWWQRGLCFNVVFLTLFAVYLLWAVRGVPCAYQAQKLAVEQEKELVQSRISIMLSQIQPHFLYNSLNSIGYLCEKDPSSAKTAVDNFADYLRGNLDSIKRTTPVPFEKELDHIRIYLSLEKMRFDEELNLVWNIDSTEFLIPSLTVQPLVENAVKYGVGKKAGGGTVTISSAEYPDRFEVVISDDGVGYDPTVTQADGRTHIGIDNVRTRLAAMVGGTLEIESRQDEGTTATITIPKEARK